MWTLEWDSGDLSVKNLKRLRILGSYRRDLDFIEGVELKLRERIYDLVSPGDR